MLRDYRRVKDHCEALARWREVPVDEQLARFEILHQVEATRLPAGSFDPQRHQAVKLLVWGCDYRGGPALECGCTETRICLAGKGKPIPGTDATDVTDADCRSCVGGD